MSELSNLFKLVAEEKKRKKEEVDSLIGDSFEKLFVDKLPSKNKNKEPQIVKEETFEVLDYHKEKIDEFKEELVEKSLGLLAEPSEVKQQNDPLTPLNQNFATLEDLDKHYKLFLSRIQQQLSTLGGGGETNLAYMDMPLTYVTSSTYTIKPQDYYIGINYAGAVTITLPTPRKEGKVYIVKDELGQVSQGTNRYITILPSGSDLIDGEDKAILAFDFGSLTFVYRNGWRVV